MLLSLQVCMHVHKVFPYMYVRLDDAIPDEPAAVDEYLAHQP